MQEVLEKFETLNILVNNAEVEIDKSITEYSEEGSGLTPAASIRVLPVLTLAYLFSGILLRASPQED